MLLVQDLKAALPSCHFHTAALRKSAPFHRFAFCSLPSLEQPRFHPSPRQWPGKLRQPFKPQTAAFSHRQSSVSKTCGRGSSIALLQHTEEKNSSIDGQTYKGYKPKVQLLFINKMVEGCVVRWLVEWGRFPHASYPQLQAGRPRHPRISPLIIITTSHHNHHHHHHHHFQFTISFVLNARRTCWSYLLSAVAFKLTSCPRIPWSRTLLFVWI